jgi:hypothetical protein
MAGTTPTTAHRTPDRRPESRFTFGLILDVAKVLEAHGYERLDGPQFRRAAAAPVRPAPRRRR